MEQRDPTSISCILSDWVIVTMPNEKGLDLDIESDEIAMLFGKVERDYKGRFRQGQQIHSSIVTDFDKKQSRVKTMNSVYLLHGDGFAVKSDIRFFAAFKFSICTPIDVCEKNPSIIFDKKEMAGGDFLSLIKKQ